MLILSHLAVVAPSAPGLMVAAGADLRTFDFTITPPSNSECVDEYFITITDSESRVDSVITVPAGMSTSPPGFNLCANTYSFAVVAATSQVNGTASPSMNFPSTGEFCKGSVIIKGQLVFLSLKSNMLLMCSQAMILVLDLH